MKNLAPLFIVTTLLCGACHQSNSKLDAGHDVASDGGLLPKSLYSSDLTPGTLRADSGDNADAAADAAVASACGKADCGAKTKGCDIGYCDEQTGKCKTRKAADTTVCDDGDPCTIMDICKAGVCAGAKLVCGALNDDCNYGDCDKATGACVPVPHPDGTSCSDGDVCTTDDICSQGKCHGGGTLDCSGLVTPCHAATCDPTTGCKGVPLTGTSCDDSDPCTDTDTCNAGTCAGTAVDCSPFAGPCSTAACVAGVGGCKVTAKNDGTSCDDGTKCTTGDTCDSGECIGTPKVCPSSNVCSAPICDAATGNCGQVPLRDGTSCNDSDACTIGDHCQSGTCLGSPKVCPASTCMVATCQSPSGTCGQAPAANGVSCDTDATDCVTGTCHSGACQNAAHADCSACGAASSGFVCNPYAACGPATLYEQYSFDGGTLDPRFNLGAPVQMWSQTTSTSFSGAGSLQSAVTGNGQSSTLEISMRPGSSTRVSFWVSVSSEAASTGKAGDSLALYVVQSNGVIEQKRWQGNAAWAHYSFFLTSTVQKLRFVYEKDASGSAGSDRAWLDELEIEDEPQPFSFAATSLAPLATSGNQLFVTNGSSAASSTGLTPNQESVLTLPMGFTRNVTVGFSLDATLSANDVLTVSVDGNQVFSFSNMPAGAAYWPVFVAAGSTAVEWQVTRAAGSPAAPVVSISDIAVIPELCP